MAFAQQIAEVCVNEAPVRQLGNDAHSRECPHQTADSRGISTHFSGNLRGCHCATVQGIVYAQNGAGADELADLESSCYLVDALQGVHIPQCYSGA